jgi:hypothetical protein
MEGGIEVKRSRGRVGRIAKELMKQGGRAGTDGAERGESGGVPVRDGERNLKGGSE